MINKYSILVNSLRLLCFSYEKQRSLMSPLSDVPDEVVSIFENAFLLLPEIIEGNIISNKAISSIISLNNKLNWCLRNIDLDDFSNDDWNIVRQLAKESLKYMKEDIIEPDMLMI